MGGFIGDFVKSASGGRIDLDQANAELQKTLAKANEEAANAGRAVADAARAAAAHTKAAADAAFQAQKALALLPMVIANAAATGKPNDVRDAIAELVRVSSNAVSAASLAASSPYFLAADLSSNDTGDGAKILRGAIAGKLVEINLVPALLKQIARLDAKTPEDAAKAIVTAPFSAVLATFLEAAYEALEPSATKIPALVRNYLRPFFKPEVLDSVKYIVSPIGLTLPEVINGTQVFMGNHAHAVTVGNLIAFSIEPRTTDDDVFWWAHEICHVEQYANLGFSGFAKAYCENYSAIENQAEARAQAVKDSLSA